MKKMLGFTLMAILTLAAQAQITITQDEAPVVGTAYTQFSSAGEVNWAPGSGGSQTWNITSFTFTNDLSASYVSPSSTPYADLFPNATLCADYYQSTYTYYRVAANGLYYQGFVVPTDSVPFVQQPDAEVLILPFPCTNGTTWTSVMRMTSEPIPGFEMSTVDSSVFTVEGWGTMTTPQWTAAALRLYDHSWYSTLLNGVPMGDPLEGWNYQFATENPARSVSYSSVNSTGPNFTTGDIYYGAEGSVGVNPVRGPVANSFKLSQNYPNPFNPSTSLPIELSKATKIEMTIYNEVGQVVSSQEFDLAAGQHSLPIDGSAWGTGSYFAKVTAGAEAQTTRMVLVK